VRGVVADAVARAMSAVFAQQATGTVHVFIDGRAGADTGGASVFGTLSSPFFLRKRCTDYISYIEWIRMDRRRMRQS
jgi:hypothetical protein